MVERIPRYLQGTLNYGLTYKSLPDIVFTLYSDSDWASDINTRRSVTGYVVFFGCNPISWQSKKQSSVSHSSIEAKYRALAHCATDVCWIQNILLPYDNLSTIALSSNLMFHSHIKHLDTDFHFVRENVQNGGFLVQHISTKEQIADILTKGLHGPTFAYYCYNLNLGVPG